MDAFHYRTKLDVTEILSCSLRSIFPKRLKDDCRKTLSHGSVPDGFSIVFWGLTR